MVASCWWMSIWVLFVAMATCNFCLFRARTVDEEGDKSNNELVDGITLHMRLETAF